MAGEVGDHNVGAAVELAGLPLTWLDAHGVDAIELAGELDHLVLIGRVDKFLVEDLLTLAIGDHDEHVHEHFKIWLVEHHSAVVLVFATILGHCDVAVGQLCRDHLRKPAAENVRVRIQEERATERQPERVYLFETIVPPSQESRVAVHSAVLIVPIWHDDQCPASASEKVLVVHLHGVDDQSNHGVARHVLLNGHSEHDCPIDVRQVPLACIRDYGSLGLGMLYTLDFEHM